jgi:hypothetical protein
MIRFAALLCLCAAAVLALPQTSEARIRVRAPGVSLNVGAGYGASNYAASSFALHAPALCAPQCVPVAAPAPVLVPRLQLSYQQAVFAPAPQLQLAPVYQAPLFAPAYVPGYAYNRSFNVGYGASRSFAFATPGVQLNVNRGFAFANQGVNVNVGRGLFAPRINVLTPSAAISVNRGLLGRRNVNVKAGGGIFSKTRIVVR